MHMMTALSDHFHDDFVVQIEAPAPAPLLLIERLIPAANLVNKIAQQHAMKLQFAAGHTQAVIQLCGRGKKAAMLILAEHKPSDTMRCIEALPLDNGDTLRVVTNYTHLGTMAVATECSAQALAHRRRAAQAAEKRHRQQ